ncbi:MAG: cytochrome c-type biogenesis protein CcmH [Rhodospirillaceae bacterium]|jgi:cytochrome c-type biogenesis protein CcmH|nr:cytochrome c-type biogenesis protein CcmH [Rhodospirillaceae bacterium]
MRALSAIGRRMALGLALCAALAAPALAVQPDEVLADPALERRARDIGQELRCLVCQNQSIDESDAPLARDLRVLVRERLTAGDTDEEIMAFVTARYGDFVLLEPPFKAKTWLLWLAPAGILALGALVVLTSARRRGARAEPDPLTPEERTRVDALLAERRGGNRAP